jgi:uncharacterized protein DUF4406
VLEPNRSAAAAAVAAARERHASRSVINPAEFDLEGVTQTDYDVLCERIICEYVARIVLAEGWHFSRGARLEAVLAIRLGLEVEDCGGKPLTPDAMTDLMDHAVTTLKGESFPREFADALLPEPSVTG